MNNPGQSNDFDDEQEREREGGLGPSTEQRSHERKDQPGSCDPDPSTCAAAALPFIPNSLQIFSYYLCLQT